MTNIDFREEEIKKLKTGDCIEKEIDGEKILVCGVKADMKKERIPDD